MSEKTEYEKRIKQTKKEIEEKVLVNKGWTEELINDYNIVCVREEAYKRGRQEERNKIMSFINEWRNRLFAEVNFKNSNDRGEMLIRTNELLKEIGGKENDN